MTPPGDVGRVEIQGKKCLETIYNNLRVVMWSYLFDGWSPSCLSHSDSYHKTVQSNSSLTSNPRNCTVDRYHPFFAAYKDISGDEGQPNPQRPRFGAGSIFPPVHWCNPSRVSRWHRRAHGARYQKSTYEANWLRCRSRNSRVLVTGEDYPKRDSKRPTPGFTPHQR